MKKFYKRFLAEAEESPCVMGVYMLSIMGLAVKDIYNGVYSAIPALILSLGLLGFAIKDYKRKY